MVWFPRPFLLPKSQVLLPKSQAGAEALSVGRTAVGSNYDPNLVSGIAGINDDRIFFWLTIKKLVVNSMA